MGKLNALTVQKTNIIGLHGDGNGLYLQVSKSRTKSWIFRYMFNGKAHAMGLGPTSLVTLAEARLKSLELKKEILNGKSPLESKRINLQAKNLEISKSITFDECARGYINAHRSGWKNAKHAKQWENTLNSYASPLFGKLSIQEVDTTLVLKVIEPLWLTKTETASRLRNRIELIISWATVRGYRTGDNPARWKSHLEQLLPKRSAVQKVEHFAALPYKEMNSFIEKLRSINSIAALAFEFQVLTASRTNETTGAAWSEINFEECIWTIPANRMKAKREHRIPLCNRAIEILRNIKLGSSSKYIFCGRTVYKPLSNNAFLSIIKKQMQLNITAHGFRSTFRDWAAERTNYPREVVEKALAHSLRDATESAYQRGDLLLRRRSLMLEWERFCNDKSPNPGLVLENFAQSNEQTLNFQLI